MKNVLLMQTFGAWRAGGWEPATYRASRLTGGMSVFWAPGIEPVNRVRRSRASLVLRDGREDGVDADEQSLLGLLEGDRHRPAPPGRPHGYGRLRGSAPTTPAIRA